MRATLNAARSKWGASVVPSNASAMRRKSLPVAIARLNSRRLITPADDRRADAAAGQFPPARAAGVLVGAVEGVDQVRLAARHGGPRRVAKVARAVDGDPLDAGGTRH